MRRDLPTNGTATRLAVGKERADVAGVSNVVVDLDPDRMRQVLTNLLTNALRHGPRDAAITIALRCDESGVSIDVDDSSPDPCPPTGSAGTGLGLSIVDALVAAHGGTFRLAPNDRHGSTATVHLMARSAAR